MDQIIERFFSMRKAGENHLPGYYRKGDGATKKKIPGCIFAEKLVKWHWASSVEHTVSWSVLFNK
jgi:hypothetical protein